MKSRSPPETMKLVKPLASRWRSNSTMGAKPEVAVAAVECRMLVLGEERVRRRGVVVHRLAGISVQHPAHQQLHVGIVAVVVLDHHLAQPTEVALVGGLPGLSLAQRLI